MINTIDFLIQGSSKEPYKVSFKKTDNNLSAKCNCKAAINGQHCKHRINILNGDIKNIVSDNAQEVDIITKWLQGTKLQKALNNFFDCDRKAAKAKKNLTNAKKELVKAMQ